tara:strand:- start:784 stop:1068 length:285 start_codon:yes stop_codon:yes gene_type:complete
MSSLERKLKRNQEKETKKVEKKLAKKLNMFDKLPENCLVCEEGYDRRNKEQAASWRVVVRPDAVRLYCPTCWNKATEIIEKFIGENSESKDSDS